MKLNELLEAGFFRVLNAGDDGDKELTRPFCCDMLSVAMSHATAGCVWVTVMGNVNALAVASLTDAACIVLAENAQMEPAVLQKAATQGITVLATEMPIFEAALSVYQFMRNSE
ncbi:MAG: DRTGG domain-containing protein [Planctomycetia bacterium]|nr:DRTGG domain-containing protein [Planctomycetia bacterium]